MTSDDLAQRVAAAARRVSRLEDVAAIADLHRDYVRRLADRDWDGMIDDFLPDAVVSLRGHGVRRGHVEIGDLFAAMHSAGSPPDAYLLSSPEIEVSGDEGWGWWTWQRHFTELPVMGGGMRITGPWWEGRYRTRYRRSAGRWRFAEMWFRLVAPRRDPDADDVLGIGRTEEERGLR
ncbi:MAG: nuclear transport factor 2 family protein [Microbacterium sp.]|uniref:nuclear transport factor 2 family protein n=1 Tax=Microbacterium sp. TaxID=51671 RepID=UPI0039E6D841